MPSTLGAPIVLVNGLAVDPACRAGYPDEVETVADRVRVVLQRSGWSQRELSRRAGLSEASIQWILKHPDRPTASDTLKAIADAAGVSAAWLLTGKGTSDSLDPTEPSTTDAVLGHVPIYANAQGWADAVTDYTSTEQGAKTPKVILRAASQRNAYHLHGPVTKDVVAALVGLVLAETSKEELARMTDASDARLEQLLAAQPAEAAEFERKVREAAEKKAGRKAKGPTPAQLADAVRALELRGAKGIDETPPKGRK